MATILLIDDYTGIREFFSEELSDEGHKVVGMAMAESAMSYLDDFHIDLVLLEPYLGKTERWDILSEIKHNHPHLPVIIVTACDFFLADERASMADDIWIKSLIHLDALKQKIQNTVRHIVCNLHGGDIFHITHQDTE
jgi:DNA-binding NtrC family response regulator